MEQKYSPLPPMRKCQSEGYKLVIVPNELLSLSPLEDYCSIITDACLKIQKLISTLRVDFTVSVLHWFTVLSHGEIFVV